MFDLSSIYQPITAQPFLLNGTHTEIQPCEALKPFVHCFWGTPNHYKGVPSEPLKSMLVIPDTCMDIVVRIDMSNNRLNSYFVGISDTTFENVPSTANSMYSCFAIRFYSWAVPLFSNDSSKNILNTFTDVDTYFHNFKCELQNIILDNPAITDRIKKVEQFLLKKLNLNKQNNNVMNAVYKILESKGTSSISEISAYSSISQRQMERLFLEYIGVSPKKFSSLVRYQNLWRDILFSKKFDIQDSVFKYGYSDQSHLLKDFKKYHTLSPADAKKFALERNGMSNFYITLSINNDKLDSDNLPD